MRMSKEALLGALGLSLLGGCGFFGGDDDPPFADESGGPSELEEGGDPPPREGFRVFPQFMLQAVAAIVTIEAPGANPVACLLDAAPEGGYVCDAEPLPGAIATIRVAKDGFELAVRNPQIVAFNIPPLDVHLSVEGGSSGSWSACVTLDEGFESCAELCAAEALVCAVTACATEQAEWPLASLQTFTGPDCGELLESLATSCGEPVPSPGLAGSLRCCCQ